MDIEEYWERERIRKIKASLEKYRIKEPELIPQKPIINQTQIKHKKVNKVKHGENISNSNINNNIKNSEKKMVKSEIKSEKKIIPQSSSSANKENKEKKEIIKNPEKPKDIINKDINKTDNNNKVINKDLLNKKREREDKEKTEKKDKKIIPQKKIVKKPIEHKKILDDDYEDDEDEEDSDYDDEEDKSYSDSSESDNDEEENSSSESSKKKKPKPQIHKKIISKKTEKKESGNSSIKKTPLKPKGALVNDLLRRWWYALPAWPPENFDTSEKLKENKLRLVKIADWKKEPKLDKDNFEKCYELPGFKYVYLNSDGKIFDLRPEEGKPSYNNLIKLPDVKLHEYLAKALKAQLAELEKRNSVQENELRKTIKEKLDKEEKTLQRLK